MSTVPACVHQGAVVWGSSVQVMLLNTHSARAWPLHAGLGLVGALLSLLIVAIWRTKDAAPCVRLFLAVFHLCGTSSCMD